MILRKLAIGSVLFGSLLVSACSGGEGNSSELSGVATINLSRVPEAVQCLQIRAQNSAQAVTRSFDVIPEQSAVLDLRQLPTGSVTFAGSAFSQACADVTGASSATWTSEPVAVQV